MTAATPPEPFEFAERPVLTVVPESQPDGDLSVDELGSRIVGLAGRLAAATCRWLLLVADFDARQGHTRFGLYSTARWLAHYCSLSGRTAKEHVRVARALAAHPALAAGMQAGRLSYSHVRAISRIADAGNETLLGDLINIAEHGTVRQLEDTVRGLRCVDDVAEGRDAEPEPEHLSHGWRADSRWGMSARLDPDHGALVQTALETIARREGISQAQALTRMAEIALAATADDGEAPSLRGDEYAAVVVNVEADALPTEEGGSREHPPAGRVAGGPGLPDDVLRRLMCSGRIRTVVRDRDGTVLDLGRSHRLVSGRLFRALLMRDRGCGHPGCGSRIGLEAHHVRHWIQGGRTDQSNLVLLCRAHHHALHDGAFTVAALGRGRFRFDRDDGSTLPRRVDPWSVTPTRRPVEEEHADIAPEAIRTDWDGTRMSHDFAISGIAQGLLSVIRRRSA